jgi:hypothetical protein
MAQHPLDGASYEGFEYLGHSDQGGRPEAVQVMVADGYAYLGQSQGLTVLDVRDPRAISPVFHRAVLGAKTWSGHLQVHGDLLLVNEEIDNGLFPASSPRQSMFGQAGTDFSAGMRVYDIADRAKPREIGFMPVAGCGVHRMWYDGGRYAFVSAFLDGYTDAIFLSVDMRDPAQPVEVGRWWVPGMWEDGGEKPTWPGRYALHHPIVKDDVAYCSWRDGGMVMLDVHDPASPTLISHTNWCPPFGGNTHNCVGLPDRQLVVVVDEASGERSLDQVKHTWIFDVREPSRPVSVSTLPTPAERDFFAEPGPFGPHNIYENRAGAWQDSSTVFVTYQNAGLRAFDITDQYRPRQTAYFVAAPPEQDPSTPASERIPLHSVDVFVTADGVCFVTDLDRGLFALQYQG